MGKIRFSKEAIKAGFLVENPGVYEFELTGHRELPATTGSVNHLLTWTGRSGEMDGVPVTMLINENASWVALPIWQAILHPKPPVEDEDYNWEDAIGVHLKALCKRGTRYGSNATENQLSDFRPVSMG